MKYSELDIEKLTDSDIYDLVMDGIIDYAKQDPSDETRSDFLIVLGSSPIPLEARVNKMMELYKKGYGKNILLSGGTGWHKLFKVTKKDFKSYEEMSSYMKQKAKKHKEMKQALKRTILDKETDHNLTVKKGKTLYKYMNRRFTKMLDNTEAELAYKIMRASQDVLDIPDSKVFFEPDSINTVQNLKYSRELIDSLQKNKKIEPVKRIMIITSCFHCRRSILSFRKYFPNIDVVACPSTLDLKRKGLDLKKERLMNDKYYMQQLRNEASAIVNYTRNRSIEDAEIQEFVNDKTALERIQKHQSDDIEL